MVVVVGVLATWVYLKRTAEPVAFEIPDVPTLTVLETRTTGSDIELAENAFAAGRLAAPVQDNALHYFQRALAQQPDSADAADGVQRVLARLLANAETSIYQADWDAARTYVAHILETEPSHAAANAVQTRIEHLEQLETLNRQASRQVTENKLTQPTGNNAVETYMQMLSIAPDNVPAQRGLDSIANRFLGSAQSAALAGNTEAATAYLDKARAIAPLSPAIAETEALVKTWTAIATDQNIREDLAAAADAMQNGRFVRPQGNNALAFFRRAQQKAPESQAATRGIALVQDALVQRAWSLVRSDDLDNAKSAVDDASNAKASKQDLAPVIREIERREQMALVALETGPATIALADLHTLEVSYPSYPTKARRSNLEGWVRIDFTVTETGRVADIAIAESSHAVFEPASRNALNRWRFEPYRIDGEPAAVNSSIQFTFRPDAD